MELKICNVSKILKKKVILDNVNIEMKSGKVYGFVGANGSGKTMLFRAISGIMFVTSGEIKLDDKVLHKDMQVLPNIGLVIENAGLYSELTGFENLKQLARINKKASDEDIKNAIKRVGLDPNDKRSFKKYSLGMKQRIIIAQAIMENPKILLLDEPTNALDEDGIEILRTIVKEEKEKGALILLASHNKEDINILCDEIYRVKNGKVTRMEDVK